MSALPANGSGLAAALRERTRLLHRRAERTGIVGDIIRGNVDRYKYGVYLRNLLPVYSALEQRLEFARGIPGVGLLARREIYRAPAIEADLGTLFGPDWFRLLPMLPVGAEYGRRVAAAAEHGGVRLIGHAYTRFLGDLNGGEVLKRLLTVALGDACGLTFYEFPAIAGRVEFAEEYRAAIDIAGTEIEASEPAVEEAAVAFELNIRLSEQVRNAVPR